ncbi:UNVERIFIED_CONTAM: Ankyrin repeat-containing protein ITN1 [Sesamum angustifolium]|uniref:Ankyrin repeat-containing protein ITN1 n=1 Tax=Sesamum angustifolium TaxID=2727405 RepID=A0AAW2IYJ9_9LAMI
MPRKYQLRKSRSHWRISDGQKSKKRIEGSSTKAHHGDQHSLLQGVPEFEDDRGFAAGESTNVAEASVAAEPLQVVEAIVVHPTGPHKSKAEASVAAVPLPVVEAIPVHPTGPHKSEDSGNRSERPSVNCTLMYQAAMRGDWQDAEILLQRDPNLASAAITGGGDTALHMAAATKHTKFVEKLVQNMTATNLLCENKHGFTAFCYAAASGIVKIAAVMREKNENLMTHPENSKMKPIHIAALLGNKDMVSYLYRFTRVKDLSTDQWFDLLIATIRNNMHDISAREEAILKRLHTLFAAVPLPSRLKRILKQPLMGIFEQSLMRKNARLVAERLWSEMRRLEGVDLLELLGEPPILHEAAKVGNVGLITTLTRTDPNLIWKRKLAPPERLKVVSGAALQMQRELLWFKEVEKVVPPLCLEKRNRQGKRPRELFSTEHKSLLTKGETWMKETANNCMIVATLIATVAFAAAFTLPGGNNGDTGMPILMKRMWFTVFAVSNGVALFCSTTSIIMFLSILTSRYQEDDFLVSLPTKLMFGLTALFFSIVGVVFAFTSTFFLLFHDEETWVLKWIAVSACILLVPLFGWLHIKLWIDTVRSAYRSKFLFRQNKHSLY